MQDGRRLVGKDGMVEKGMTENADELCKGLFSRQRSVLFASWCSSLAMTRK